MTLFASAVMATGDGTVPTAELSPFPVIAPMGLNDEPAVGLATVVTRLRYAPGVDLQTRGFAELQSDLTVRGSTFEQTGLLLGTVPLFDPQTGHYATELPFGDDMLGAPELMQGTANARLGFNANVASVVYHWAPVEARGRLVLGAGTDALLFGELYQGNPLGARGWAYDVAAGHAQGDGTVPGGDFRVWRGALRVQHRSETTQTDIAVGWLDKFFGWPGMYTGFASLLETDDFQNLVVVAQHRQGRRGESHWVLGGAFREMDDDYYFNRTTPPEARASRFQHLTRTGTVAAEGAWLESERWDFRGRAVWLGDALVRSTSLVNGDPATGNDFTRRQYGKVAAAAETGWEEEGGAVHRLELGITGVTSTEDTGSIQPLARWERRSQPGFDQETVWFAQYAETSQVPGYTALRSAPRGLFGGNPNLGRERSRVAEGGMAWERAGWQLRASLFHRWDRNLVDWTYAAASPNARQANALDLETAGVEMAVEGRFPGGRAHLSYAWLEKAADYGTATVDGSFYALNFPRHRLLGGLEWRVRKGLELAAEGEYRVAEANPRRTTGDRAVLLSLALRWQPWGADGLEWNLLVDNLTDEDFQEFPGTPAVGRHGSLRVVYRW